MFISAVKLGILTWWWMEIDSLPEPASSGHLQFLALLHWLNFTVSEVHTWAKAAATISISSLLCFWFHPYPEPLWNDSAGNGSISSSQICWQDAPSLMDTFTSTAVKLPHIGLKDSLLLSMFEKWVWTSRAPLLICSANLGFDVEVMEKSCGAVWSVIYKLTCLMECGIHMSPTRLEEVHADRWMREVLVGEI